MDIDGALLRRLRENAGLSQQELADAASISRAHLSMVEADLRECSPPVASRLASVLGVAIVDLR